MAAVVVTVRRVKILGGIGRRAVGFLVLSPGWYFFEK